MGRSLTSDYQRAVEHAAFFQVGQQGGVGWVGPIGEQLADPEMVLHERPARLEEAGPSMVDSMEFGRVGLTGTVGFAAGAGGRREAAG